jgi:hypothetical protein
MGGTTAMSLPDTAARRQDGPPTETVAFYLDPI